MRNRPRLNSMTLTRGMRERLPVASDFVEQLKPMGVVDMNLPSPHFAGEVAYNSGGGTGTAKVGVLGANNTIRYRDLSVMRREYTYEGKLSGLSLDSVSFTNFLFDTENLNTSWVATSLTKPSTPNAIGPDGLTSAVTLTATGSPATLVQTRGAIGTGNKRFSVWLRRVSGSGDVEIALNTAAYLKVTVTSEWKRFEVFGTTSVIVGIRMSGSSPFQVIEVFAPTCTRQVSGYGGNAPEIIHSTGANVVYPSESLFIGGNYTNTFGTFVLEGCPTRQANEDRAWTPSIWAEAGANDALVAITAAFEPTRNSYTAYAADPLDNASSVELDTTKPNIVRVAASFDQDGLHWSFNGGSVSDLGMDLSSLGNPGVTIGSSGCAIRYAALYGMAVDPFTLTQLSRIRA